MERPRNRSPGPLFARQAGGNEMVLDCSDLESACREKGPQAALEMLENHMRENGDYTGWFYTLLMRARVDQGLDPTPTAPAEEIPAEKHEAYEEAIRAAGRKVGQEALKKGQLEAAWQMFKLLGEPEPVRRAILDKPPEDEDDWELPIRLAYYEGLAPEIGFDWILRRYGLCNAITTLSQETPGGPGVRQHCLRALVRALREELMRRLRADWRHRQGLPQAETDADLGPPPAAGEIIRFVDEHPELTEEDCYHIDLSHLQSTIQLSSQLGPCEERGLARELCAYGQRLKGRFVPKGEPPFEDFFGGWDHFLGALEGDRTEEHISFFKDQAQRAAEEGNPYPSEILLDLLRKLGRDREALEAAAFCQSPASLRSACRDLKDFRAMREASRRQEDRVHFLAALLEQRNMEPRAR